MMGHREKMVGGDEFDLLPRRARRVMRAKRGEIKGIKRKYNKRVRYIAKRRSQATSEDHEI